MTSELLHKDIAAINVRLLSLAQQLFKESPAEAMLRFGMSMGQLEKLSALDTIELEQIASAGRTIYKIDHPLLEGAAS